MKVCAHRLSHHSVSCVVYIQRHAVDRRWTVANAAGSGWERSRPLPALVVMHMLRYTTKQGSEGHTAAQGSISRGGCGALMPKVAETKSFGGRLPARVNCYAPACADILCGREG